jgi:hypothetical protein
LEASNDILLELEGLELEELISIFPYINFNIYEYIFLCTIEASNKNLLALESLGIGRIERMHIVANIIKISVSKIVKFRIFLIN